MGIPGLFKRLYIRYPHIVDATKKKITPKSNKADFLYLDINALFHIALSKNQSRKPKNPRQMLSRVFHEMDFTIEKCKPQLVYIAMDGVAPRAKMNEQRSRRYVYQNDNFNIHNQIRNSNGGSGDNIKNSENLGFFVPIDSVSISAGTDFMAAANEAIRYYIYQRLNWKYKTLQIIFNDSKVPGEGEHKIFRYLNTQCTHPGYNSRNRHVVCGSDADFIMYALLTNEPNIRILRTGVVGDSVMVNIHKLRRHIIVDMLNNNNPNKVSIHDGGVDENNLIDDFVFLVSLLGNDFMPRLKHIGEASVDLLFQAYSTYFDMANGSYITNKRQKQQPIIDFNRLHQFFECLEFIINSNPLRRRSSRMSDNLDLDEATLSNRANDYVKTMCWSFLYYNGDCPSWRFFYPYHKSPTIREILKYVNPSEFKPKFTPDCPMNPFEQLVCIIPPSSNYLLPESLRDLLTNPESPLKDFFPKTYQTKRNGAAILPFIEEEILLDSVKQRYQYIDKNELEKNSLDGKVHIFSGSKSTTYPIIYSLCRSLDNRFTILDNSIIYGKLNHGGDMLRTIKTPVDGWNQIYHNSVAFAEYNLPNQATVFSHDLIKSLQ
nr:15013_t:CDS:1 [Entrophospora candida]